jgi:hypothetical protein
VFGWPAGALTGQRLIKLMDVTSGLRMARALRARHALRLRPGLLLLPPLPAAEATAFLAPAG